MKKIIFVVFVGALAVAAVGIVLVVRGNTSINNTNVQSNINTKFLKTYNVQNISLAIPDGYLFCPETNTIANKYVIASLWLDKTACEAGQDAPEAWVYLQTEATDVKAALQSIGAQLITSTNAIQEKIKDRVPYVVSNVTVNKIAFIGRKISSGSIVFQVQGITSYQQDLSDFELAVVQSQ